LTHQAVELGPELLAAGAGGVAFGGEIPERGASEVSDDGDQAAFRRAGAQGGVEVGQADPGRAGSYRSAEQASEPVGGNVVKVHRDRAAHRVAVAFEAVAQGCPQRLQRQGQQVVAQAWRDLTHAVLRRWRLRPSQWTWVVTAELASLRRTS
jgi:hypothetical protein